MSDVAIKAPVTKDGLMAYFEQFLGGERGETSADVISDVMLLAVSEEREACARISEVNRGGPVEVNEKDWPGQVGHKIAEAIRRRGRVSE